MHLQGLQRIIFIYISSLSCAPDSLPIDRHNIAEPMQAKGFTRENVHVSSRLRPVSSLLSLAGGISQQSIAFPCYHSAYSSVPYSVNSLKDRRSSGNCGTRARHFCPKIYVRKFTKFPNFTRYLPENYLFPDFFGGGRTNAPYRRSYAHAKDPQ